LVGKRDSHTLAVCDSLACLASAAADWLRLDPVRNELKVSSCESWVCHAVVAPIGSAQCSAVSYHLYYPMSSHCPKQSNSICTISALSHAIPSCWRRETFFTLSCNEKGRSAPSRGGIGGDMRFPIQPTA
jgi:hypothetical protein